VRRLVPLALALGLAAPGSAAAGGFAVGVARNASFPRVAERVATLGARVSRDPELRVVYAHGASRAALARLPGVSYVDPLRSRRLAFAPNDPLVSRQWYLGQINAFDFWPQLPSLPGTKVAVIDSGIDGGHPDLDGRVAAARTFVGGSPFRDGQGHGTFVAGEIAAATGNGTGIAGIAFPAQLLVAKVVKSDRTIPLQAEASGIRWAVDHGARVINLSLAGLRDPLTPNRDTYSPLEASAIRYADRHGVIVVAAVGNSDAAPRSPWNFAGYPAALPHVIGVSALEQNGSVAAFSNRDAFYNDISAPGADIFSTLPLQMTHLARPNCPYQGYSDCGDYEFRRAEGTSFAAPMVTAAAALVLSIRPSLAPDQVEAIVERSAADANSATGCKACLVGRDRLSGWGRLDVAEAIRIASTGPFARADTREPNDNAGSQAFTIWSRAPGRIQATLDFWDDRIDVYRMRLHRGQRLYVKLSSASGESSSLSLWPPGTDRVDDLSPAAQRKRLVQSRQAGSVERIRGYRARKAGWYYVEVKLDSKGAGPYSLTYSKR
jgi:subtilisin family serine protease